MKCRKRTQSGQECSSVLLNGPKGYVCPCEMSHQDAQAYEAVITTTVHLTADRLNAIRARFQQLWPRRSFNDTVSVIEVIVQSYIGTGDFAELVDEPEVMISLHSA